NGAHAAVRSMQHLAPTSTEPSRPRTGRYRAAAESASNIICPLISERRHLLPAAMLRIVRPAPLQRTLSPATAINRTQRARLAVVRTHAAVRISVQSDASIVHR